MTALELLEMFPYHSDVELSNVCWSTLKDIQSSLQSEYEGFITVEVFNDYSFNLIKKSLKPGVFDKVLLSGTIATSGPIMEVDNEK